MSWKESRPGSRDLAVLGAIVLAALLSPITFPRATAAQEVASPLEELLQDLI